MQISVLALRSLYRGDYKVDEGDMPRSRILLLCRTRPSLECALWWSFLRAVMKRYKELSLKLAQHINIYFCVKIGLTKRETVEGIELVYGTNSLSRRRIRHWHGAFSNGRTVLVDLHREARAMSGRSRANIRAVQRLVSADRRLNVRALAAQANLSKSTVHSILWKDLHLVRKSAKFVPHLLSPANLRQQLEACLSLLRLHR